MCAYYNENDPKAAAWLRELIKAGLIADGEVDERSITDVRPDDLRRFAQCHFFAGIGGWSYALRRAGWPDDRHVWTGSCPCQPWSAAGAGLEADDPRDLWPAWFELLRECRPRVVFGEQVAGKAGWAWIDRLCDDLEACGYAIGPVDLPACSVGAPHRRQRLWFVAHDHQGGRPQFSPSRLHGDRQSGHDAARRREDGNVADAASRGLGIDGSASWEAGHADERSQSRDMGNAIGARLQGGGELDISGTRRWREGRGVAGASETSGPWREVEWIECRDGKRRPVEPGIEPLAHGIPARVGRLRGFGNAIVPQVAAEVIGAYMEIEP